MRHRLSHNVFWLLLAVCTLSSWNCGDDSATPRFEVLLESAWTIPIDQVALFVQGTATDPNKQSFIDLNLMAEGMAADQIESILPGKAVLRSKFANTDLGFLRDVSVRAVKKSDNTFVKELFYLTEIRLNEGNSMELFPALTELKDILTDPTFDLQLVVNFQAFPAGDTALELDYTYLVFDE